MLYREYGGSILLRNAGKYPPNYKGVRLQKAKEETDVLPSTSTCLVITNKSIK